MSRPSPALAFVGGKQRLSRVPDGYSVVPLDPFVAIAAASGDRDVLAAELADAEVEALGEETFRRVDQLCRTLDAALHRETGATSRWRFQQLKTLIDGMLVHALGAQRLVRELGTREAIVLADPGSLAAAVLPPVLDSAGVRVSAPLPGPASSVVDEPTLRAQAAALGVGLRRAVRRRRPRILCLDQAYSLPSIAAALRSRGADVLLWLPPPPRPSDAQAVDLSAVAPLFELAGVDLWPAASERLRLLVERELPRDGAAVRAAAAAIRRDRPDALLGSSFASPAAKAAAHAARVAGVPSIVARHGELGTQDLPLMAFNDVDVVDWALCWGTWEQRWSERHGRGARAAVAGAPMVEDAVRAAAGRSEARARLGLRDSDLVVLYVPNALDGDAWFAGKRPPEDRSHVRHQVSVLTQLLALEGVRLVVKEHPQWAGHGPLAEWASAEGVEVEFARELEFAGLVQIPDATVLDFASTTLVHALHGSARIYVVDHPVIVWVAGVVEHLQSHGVGFVAPDRVGAAVAADLASGLVGMPVSYSQEAREPLLASGPGTAADRAAEAVLRIASGEEP